MATCISSLLPNDFAVTPTLSGVINSLFFNYAPPQNFGDQKFENFDTIRIFACSTELQIVQYYMNTKDIMK